MLRTGALVTGQVLDVNGEGLPDAEILVRWRKPTWGHGEGKTDEDGCFRMVVPARTKCTLQATSPIDRILLGSARFRNGARGLVFDQRKNASLTGVLLDKTGGVLPHRVMMNLIDKHGCYCCVVSTGDEDGQVTTSLPPGKYRVAILAWANSSASFKVKLHEHQVVRKELPALKMVTVRVLILDAATGDPLRGAEVHGQLRDEWRMGNSGITEENGWAELELPPTQVRLHITCSGYESLSRRMLYLRPGRTREKVYRLKPSRSD